MRALWGAAILSLSLSLGLAGTGWAGTGSGETLPAAPDAGPQLFRVVSVRDEVTIGLTTADLDALGPEPGVARLARRLAADGHLTAWRYVVGRAPDGTTRLVATDRIAIFRHDALRIEPYHAILPVAVPPGPR